MGWPAPPEDVGGGGGDASSAPSWDRSSWVHLRPDLEVTTTLDGPVKTNLLGLDCLVSSGGIEGVLRASKTSGVSLGAGGGRGRIC